MKAASQKLESSLSSLTVREQVPSQDKDQGSEVGRSASPQVRQTWEWVHYEGTPNPGSSSSEVRVEQAEGIEVEKNWLLSQTKRKYLQAFLLLA